MRSARCWAAPAANERISLKYNADGSLDIYMQRDSPGTDKQSNWLAIPSSGMFNLTVRSYHPGEALLDGSYKLPLVVKMQ